jgi:tRNA(Ile)-lysidine synthase
MVPAGGRVLVALSGGPDSVALTLIVHELERAGECVLAGVAHLNHCLREGAAGDEAFCRELAADLDVPFVGERIDVRERAREAGRSIEDEARRLRYAFLEVARATVAADVVATGHTRDDQAETFLLRLLRGAGTRGLAAIRPVAGSIVRPLIDVRRADLEAYLAERGQRFCIDETNLDRSIPRNHVRHELIPYLQRDFSNGIVDILAREAELARLDEDRLQKEAIDSSSLIVLRSSSGRKAPLDPEQMQAGGPGWSVDVAAVEIDAAALTRLHPAVVSRVARLALSVLAPDRFVGYDHVAALLALLDDAAAEVSLPGQHASRRGSQIELVRRLFRPFANSFRFPLSIPGEVTLHAQGWAVSARKGELSDFPGSSIGQPVLAASVQADRLELPLAVRSRRHGDRFRPAGLGGRTKKLQDYLVDRKVARDERDALPMVVDGADRIVWIVGHPVAEDFRVTEPSQGVIFLKARRLGGPG